MVAGTILGILYEEDTMVALKDILSHLTYAQACKMLGPKGDQLIRQGGRFEITIDEQVSFTNNHFHLRLQDAMAAIAIDLSSNNKLTLSCSSCTMPCQHQGAALSLILEEKLALGLAAPPPEKAPIEELSDNELIERAITERQERSNTEKMRMESVNPDELWTDYIITNASSGKCYRVALRGWERGESFCSCPDFRKNTLGTCKHILFAISTVKKKFKMSVLKTAFRITDIAVYVKYGNDLSLRLLIPKGLDPDISTILDPLRDTHIIDVRDLLNRISQVDALGQKVIIYPDAEAYINRELYLKRVQDKVAGIRKDPANHPLRTTLLKTDLLPYQLDGIAFAVGAGRAVLADDMGLGKTIQGIGAAELLAQDTAISKVLVVCPASLKSQWLIEIDRFCNRSAQAVLGSAEERALQYDNACFFTICNYEQVLRDIMVIERVPWDLIILDEGQRIKNWEAKTSQTIKALRSPFALVLTGTPLENRLEELYSLVEFIDDRRLGPAFRFLNRHRVTNATGKVLGYKKLDELRKNLAPVLLRRTRQEVMKQLPPRTIDIIRIAPTEEQLELHNAQKRIIQTIISKKYINEMDMLRLQKALLLCRLAANSTCLVDKQPPGFSSKLAELEGMIEEFAAETERKVLMFSEWTGMLDLVEPLLYKFKANFVRLDGSVPQKKRQGLVHEFQHNPECTFFITTNAGSTGLNLQAANTVVNVDLPWNPAVLDQRIGRAHRMGQKRPVQVYLLVTENTLEENLLATLSAKKDLALTVLDPNATVSEITMASGIEELKKRMEILLGEKPEAPVDMSAQAKVRNETMAHAHREQVSLAGGQLLGSAFDFIKTLFPAQAESEHSDQITRMLKASLSEGMERDPDGRFIMKIALPNEEALNALASSLARVVASGLQRNQEAPSPTA